MKKMVSVFLMMLLVVTALASSAWAEGKIQPFYNQTARISASLVINGSTAECMLKKKSLRKILAHSIISKMMVFTRTVSL